MILCYTFAICIHCTLCHLHSLHTLPSAFIAFKPECILVLCSYSCSTVKPLLAGWPLYWNPLYTQYCLCPKSTYSYTCIKNTFKSLYPLKISKQILLSPEFGQFSEVTLWLQYTCMFVLSHIDTTIINNSKLLYSLLIFPHTDILKRKNMLQAKNRKQWMLLKR